MAFSLSAGFDVMRLVYVSLFTFICFFHRSKDPSFGTIFVRPSLSSNRKRAPPPPVAGGLGQRNRPRRVASAAHTSSVSRWKGVGGGGGDREGIFQEER